jgi:hypothetical protein
MKLDTKKIIGTMIVTAILVVGLIRCEEINSHGTNNNAGVVLRVNSIEAWNPAVDVTTGQVLDGTLESPYIIDSVMTVEFELDSIVQEEYADQIINSVTIEYYDIFYQCVEVQGVGCSNPQISTQRSVGLPVTIWPGKKNTFEGILYMSVARKEEFLLNGGDPMEFPLHMVTVVFYGITQFDEPIESELNFHVILGNYYTAPSSS